MNNYISRFRNIPYNMGFFFRATIVTLSVIVFSVFIFVMNLNQEHTNNEIVTVQEQPLLVSPVKSSNVIKREISIEKTAQIIVRDGKKVSPRTAKRYAKWIYDSAEKHKVNPILILSVMSVESNFDANAKSPTGPIGLLQVAYTFHKEKTTREGLYDPKNNIDVGTQILAEYSSGTDSRTLVRYYGGTYEQSNSYAKKVIHYKYKYEKEIARAVYVKTI